MKEIANEKGDIRIFAGGKTMVNAFEKDIKKANITRKPSVFVQTRGVIDVIYYDKPFTFKNEMWAYQGIEDKCDTKYLYHILKTKVDILRAKGSIMGSMPQIKVEDTEDLVIPIPKDIKEQQRIANILDKFEILCNDIKEGLPAEIEARQQQYEYYRDKLLTFKRKEVVD